MRIIKILFCFSLFAWSIGIAHPGSNSNSNLNNSKKINKIKLRFISDQNFQYNEQFKKTRLGGLSGLVYDTKEKVFHVVSDDGGKYGPARFYTFGVNLTKDKLSVHPKNVVFLKNPFGKTFKEKTVDFEGITLLSNGNLLLSTEGNNKLRIGTSLFEFQKNGKFVGVWPIPGKFEFFKIKKMKLGIRSNQGFESLASTIDGKIIFTANQQALYQDGAEASSRKSSPVRILKYVNRVPSAEYVYIIDRLGPKLKGSSGLVDLIALDSSNLLALERSYIRTAKRYIVRIFHVAISRSTTDVSKISSLLGKKWQPLSKELILDLDEVIPKITNKDKKLDNIEGMCLGPLLKNGNKTLILVSDNNFSKKQRTLFMAFEIMQGGARGHN